MITHEHLEHVPTHTEQGLQIIREQHPFITIVGIGSLLDPSSAQRTFPCLQNFRLGLIRNYVRSFNLVSISCIRNGFASMSTTTTTNNGSGGAVNDGDRGESICCCTKNKVASISACKLCDLPQLLKQKYKYCCCAGGDGVGDVGGDSSDDKDGGRGNGNDNDDEDDDDGFLYVSVFEASIECWKDFLRREHRYEYDFVRYETVEISTLHINHHDNASSQSLTTASSSCGSCLNTLKTGKETWPATQSGYGLICCQSTDERYIETKCGQSREVYEELVGQYYKGRLWYHSRHVQCPNHHHHHSGDKSEQQSKEQTSEEENWPILPVDKYVAHVLKACVHIGQQYGLGNSVFDNWLDHTYLCDFKTTLREYLSAHVPELLSLGTVHARDCDRL